MDVEGFESFGEFKKWMLEQFPPSDNDLHLSGGAGGGLHKCNNGVAIYPKGGGLIWLRDDGKWSWDMAPFSD